MPAYAFGLPADMDEIVKIANQYDLPVVADAAAALGCAYKGRPVGAIGADLTVFSFNGNKTITAGGGGAVVGNNSTLLDLVKHITTTARVGDGYDHDRVGYNYRMTNLQAAVGCAQMEQMDTFVAAKKRIAQRYNQELLDVPGIGFFPAPKWADGACWFSGLTISPPMPGMDHIIEQMRHKNIAVRTFWKPMHLLTLYQNCLATAMPVSEGIWQRVLTLPCSVNLSESDQDYVIQSLLEIFEQVDDAS
jgi:dTDP-4-amino-4,6-dideoxygalactose transaminase